MGYVEMWVEIYAAVILVYMFAEDIIQKRMGILKHASFLNLQLSAIIMVVSDIFHHLLYRYEMPENSGVKPSDIAIIVCFIAYYMTLFFFIVYVRKYIGQYRNVPRYYTIASLVVCLVFTILWILSVINGILFKIEDGDMVPGPLYALGQLGGYFIVILVVVMIKRYGEGISRQNMMVIISFSLCPIIGVVVRSIFKIQSVVVLLFSLTMVLMHIIIDLENGERVRRQEAIIADDRIRIMISQVQPHFLFNALNSIYVLCEKDPKQAQEAVGDFSEYLRANLESLETSRLISLKDEMEHVDTYLKLEKMRFQEQLMIEKGEVLEEIRIPALSLQPIVENAVRHGIGHKKDGGTVSIGSYATEDEYVVYVKDDGVGFEPESVDDKGQDEQEEILSDDGGRQRRHVGIKNVRERLRLMCDGSLNIISSPGNGCEAYITIPR
ncbi:MAG: histidine kinase [Eubacterium sp.]|nr:histidine kinase [Eubacterium sp.]